jgi:hypothetical protein
VLEAAPRGPRPVRVDLVPADGSGPVAVDLTIGRDGFDPTLVWGDHYGAEGIVALALAAHLVADGDPAADGRPAAIAVHCETDSEPGGLACKAAVVRRPVVIGSPDE